MARTRHRKVLRVTWEGWSAERQGSGRLRRRRPVRRTSRTVFSGLVSYLPPWCPAPRGEPACSPLYLEGDGIEQQDPISRPGESGLDLTKNSPHLLPRMSPHLSIGSHRQLTQDIWGVAYEQRGP